MATLWLKAGLLAGLATRALASCAHGTHLMPRAAEGEEIEIGNFGYAGDTGPLNWVGLDPTANAACATGTHQSPINMVAGSFNMLPGSTIQLDIPDMSAGAEFENLGTTIEVIAEGGSMSVGGVDYTLQQFHFHLPSEHLDDGTSMAMEMHMVWESEAGQIAVIGTYIDVDTGATAGESNPAPIDPGMNMTRRGLDDKQARRNIVRSSAAHARRQVPPMGQGQTGSDKPQAPVSNMLETVFSSLDSITTPGTSVTTEALDMSEVVSQLTAGNFQSYMGSLTTPPCSEGVQWLVATEHLSVTAATHARVRDVIGFNSRFPQGTLGEPNLLQLAGLASQNMPAPAGVAHA